MKSVVKALNFKKQFIPQAVASPPSSDMEKHGDDPGGAPKEQSQTPSPPSSDLQNHGDDPSGARKKQSHTPSKRNGGASANPPPETQSRGSVRSRSNSAVKTVINMTEENAQIQTRLRGVDGPGWVKSYLSGAAYSDSSKDYVRKMLTEDPYFRQSKLFGFFFDGAEDSASLGPLRRPRKRKSVEVSFNYFG